MFKSSNGNNYKLVFAGKPMWGEKELEAKLSKMKCREDVIFTGRISTEVLQLVLASSEALVLVSFLEGFGIPVLEAMKCEVPVICSNITSFPEVAGDAAIYADPYKTESIAESLSRIAGSNKLKEELIKKGRVQREKFSWDKTAKAVWESIEKAI